VCPQTELGESINELDIGIGTRGRASDLPLPSILGRKAAGSVTPTARWTRDSGESTTADPDDTRRRPAHAAGKRGTGAEIRILGFRRNVTPLRYT
jgi:hypothetical protein